jgi:hypothetical protein
MSGARKFFNLGLLCLIGVILASGWPSPGWARDVAINSVTVMAAAPLFLYLRIGSSGSTIDKITFPVNNLPGKGRVAGQSSGAYPVQFQARGLFFFGSGTLRLSVDSSHPLSDGLGHTIPFNQISWTGGGSIPSGRFNGSSAQTIWQASTSGSFNFQGTMAFFYDNTLFLPTGTYQGQVTYTLSSP